MGYLVLLRHGESLWNLENRFTGWVEVPLSPKGEEEARQAGEKLKAAGLRFDCAFTGGAAMTSPLQAGRASKMSPPALCPISRRRFSR